MSVKNEIRTALESGLALDSQIAIMEWGTTRLASYVCMLRADGVPIQTRNKRVQTRRGKVTVAEYFIEKEAHK